MNINLKILNLRGEEMSKSFPTKEEVKKLPKLENGRSDLDKLEKETVGNIIFYCLSNYIVKDKKEGWYIDLIAQSVLVSSNGKIELKEKIKNFLVEVLDNQTIMRIKDKKTGKEEQKGLYTAWAIVQVKKELGIKQEI